MNLLQAELHCKKGQSKSLSKKKYNRNLEWQKEAKISRNG